MRFLGRLLLVLALAEIVPCLVCVWYGERRDAFAFLATALLTAAAGAALALLGRGAREIYRREGILIVVGGWVLASISGALPYVLAGALPQPADALFESVSGFTTTGASVMTDVEVVGRGVLFWRSFSQWLGGMGIIVLFVALLPELGPGARFLYRLEVPGPTAETLHPRVHDTAAVLWKLYLGMTVAQVVLLLVAGLGLFDALTHTFSTLSTGGFSTRNASVGAFRSPWVDVIVIVFMVLSGANFSLYYGLRRRSGWNLFADAELRLYVGIIAAATAVIAWNLLAAGTYDHLPRAVLDAAFQVSSIITTTGFATADFDTWPALSRFVLVALMLLGGCAGSTAGGLKVMRLAVGWKAALREVHAIFNPSHVMPVLVGGKPVPNPVVRSVVAFLFLYFLCWGAGALLLSVGDVSLETSVTASAATLSNVGPGLDQVGPVRNFAFFAGWQKLVMVLLMWLGRLELYSIAALATLAFWRR